MAEAAAYGASSATAEIQLDAAGKRFSAVCELPNHQRERDAAHLAVHTRADCSASQACCWLHLPAALARVAERPDSPEDRLTLPA